MVTYHIRYKRSVRKDLQEIAKPQLQAVVRRIQSLAGDPRPRGCVRLHGGGGLHRVRQGDYRIIYTIRDEMLTVLVIKIGHRKGVYDK